MLLTTWKRKILQAEGVQSYVGLIPAPDNLTYIIDNNSAQDVFIKSITLVTSTGDVEATVAVDGVAVGGLEDIVADTTSLQTNATVPIKLPREGVLTLVLANNNAAENLSFNIQYQQSS